MSVFSDRLVALRKELQLNQTEFGARINKVRSTVGGYEAEGKEPDIATLITMARTFGVTTDYLLGNSDERRPVETVFFSDNINFQEHYHEMTDRCRSVVTNCFDAFYRLLDRDVKQENSLRLQLYRRLFQCLATYRSRVSQMVESASADSTATPVFLSNLMAAQSELKNEVSSLLDQLLQADMATAFGAYMEEAKGNSGSGS